MSTLFGKLGTAIQGNLRTEEALSAAGLAWSARLEQNYLSMNSASTQGSTPTKVLGDAVPYSYTCVKEDGAILGINLGTKYRIIQNKDAFSPFDYLIDAGRVTYEAMGELFGGEVVWASLKMGEPFNVRGVDPIYPYLLALNSHNSRNRFRVVLAPIRAACQNLVVVGGKDSTLMSIKHCGDTQNKIQAATVALDMAVGQFVSFTEQMERLASHPITLVEIDSLLLKLFPNENKRSESLRRAIEESYATQENMPHQLAETSYDFYNAVTQWTNHTRRIRGYEDQVQARFESVTSGTAQELNNTVLEYLLSLEQH